MIDKMERDEKCIKVIVYKLKRYNSGENCSLERIAVVLVQKVNEGE